MGRISNLLFLLFYIASGYAVRQERATLLVSALTHSCSRDDETQFNARKEQPDGGCPYYRQAKPKGIAFHALGWGPLAHALPTGSERPLHAQSFSLKSQDTLASAGWRAPPAHSKGTHKRFV